MAAFFPIKLPSKHAKCSLIQSNFSKFPGGVYPQPLPHYPLPSARSLISLTALIRTSPYKILATGLLGLSKISPWLFLLFDSDFTTSASSLHDKFYAIWGIWFFIFTREHRTKQLCVRTPRQFKCLGLQSLNVCFVVLWISRLSDKSKLNWLR